MLYGKHDFKRNNLTTGDEVWLAKIPNNAILYESWYRSHTITTSTATIDIGTTYTAGTDIVSNFNWDSDSGGEWIQGTIQTNGGAEEITDADSYLVVKADGAITDGIIEVALVFLMFPPNTTPMDHVTVSA
jgi:hypothetical protein